MQVQVALWKKGVTMPDGDSERTVNGELMEIIKGRRANRAKWRSISKSRKKTQSVFKVRKWSSRKKKKNFTGNTSENSQLLTPTQRPILDTGD